jgi:hypothetical protein
MAASRLIDVRLHMDRLFLMALVAPRELGWYQLGIFPLVCGNLVNGVLSQYLVPRILFDFGRDGDLRRVFRRACWISLGVTGSLLVLWPLAMAVLEAVVERFLPEYAPSLGLMAVSYVGACFIAGNVLTVTVLAAGKLAAYVLAMASLAALALLVFLVLGREGSNLWGFAVAATSGIVLDYLVKLLLMARLARACTTAR